MKILFLSHFIPYPPPGGSSQRNYNLIRELSRNNTVDLLTFTQRLFHPTEDKLGTAISAMKQLCREVKAIKIPTDYSRFKWLLLLFFNLFSITPYSVWRFYSREMNNALINMISANNYDIVHIDTIALARHIKYLHGIPTVLNHHNIESTLMLRRAKSEKNLLIKLYLLMQGKKLRLFEKRIAKKFSVNITVSDQDKSDLQNYCRSALISVVTNGTDINYFTPASSMQKYSLIYVGGMTWYPNRDAMTYFCREIYPLIRKQMPETEMNIIGNSPPKEVLLAASKDPSIKPLGYVEDIRAFLAQAAVYVVPIRVGGGTRLKILDAMAAGKAIVSTTVGCEGIAVTPGENILIADNPQNFSDQVVMLLKNKEMRDKLSANAREFVAEHYSWEIIGRQLVETYGSILK